MFKLGIITKDINLVITDQRFYLFSKHKLKCNAEIVHISALTKSITSQIKGELVVHLKNEKDRRIKSDFRDEIIEVIKKLFINLTSKNIPIYGVKYKRLGEFTSSKKD